MTRRNFLRLTVIGAGLLAVGGIGWSKMLDSNIKRYSKTRDLLGTFITIIVIDTNESRAADTVNDAFAEIERLSGLLSRHDPSSELSRLNNSGRLSHASAELIFVLKQARYHAELTAGSFDVTVAPLVDLYKTHFAEYNTPPDAAAVAEARSLVGYQMLALKGSDVALLKPGMRVTLDGIAKGYIVDRTVDLLKARGMSRVLVDAGGDLSLCGQREDGEPFRIGIQHPRALSGYYQVVEQSSGSMATSGDYEAAYTADFRYNHIIDPHSGLSPAELSSVTVLAHDAATADALAVSSMVLGMTKGKELVERLTGVEALLIDKQMNSQRTSGFPTPL